MGTLKPKRPRGKESTEVRKSQNKGKENENSYQELKRSQKGQAHTNTRKLNRDISTGMAIFLNRKRVNCKSKSVNCHFINLLHSYSQY